MGGYLGNQSVVTQINVSPTDVSDKDNASTGALDLPSGTTAQRPANPNTGYTRFNTTLGQQESWNGSAWVTSGGLLMQSVQTANFTAVAGNAYPVNTTAGAITVTLPASPSAGNQVQIIDYAGTAATNAITINPNGGKINGVAGNAVTTTNRASNTLVYVDSTQGWVDSSIGNAGYLPQNYSIDYLVVAGGGGAGNYGGGGGAGGLLSGSTTLNVTASYSVTVGAGGAGIGDASSQGANGSSSVIYGISTAIGGGGGGSNNASPNTHPGLSGGSGGGASNQNLTGQPGGSGTAGQGYAGGTGGGVQGTTGASSAGGGGAGGVGANSSTSVGGNGGVGAASSITGSSVYYAGGGGGYSYQGTPGNGGNGGGGNGGAGGGRLGSSGSSNTGGGGGSGVSGPLNNVGGNGGSGVVIIRYAGPQRGTGGTVTSSGGYTIHTFTSSGTFTA